MNSMSAQPARAMPETGQLELDALELLPCGCVVAVQEARPWHVKVVSLEAKGPYCTLTWHRSDNVLRLGDPAQMLDDLEGETDEEDPGEP
jgi:hypothetical protein